MNTLHLHPLTIAEDVSRGAAEGVRGLSFLASEAAKMTFAVVGVQVGSRITVAEPEYDVADPDDGYFVA